MAAVSRQLPRGLAKVHSAALGSASHLEISIASGFSGPWSSVCEEENSCAELCNRIELRKRSVLEANSLHAGAINPLEWRKLVDVRSEWRCCSTGERCLASFRSTAELQNFVFRRSNVSVYHNLRQISRKASHFTHFHHDVRSVSTAVSTDDKLRSEVDDDELDLKTGEDNLQTKRGKKRNGSLGNGETVDEEAETSIYTSAKGPALFTPADVNKLFKLSPQDREQYFGEGFPTGLLKEFDDTKETALLIRARTLQLCERFQKCRADTIRYQEQKDKGEIARFFASKPRQCLLEGLGKGGKSAALAMLVHWARMEGWLVFYVPNGREWTSVGMYFKNSQTGLFDTPVQAKTALEGFLKSHETLLGQVACRILKPLQLGEGAGMGKVRGPQQIILPEGTTLKDLVEKGVAQTHAAVSCVVRLREELNLVQEVPVLIAIDEFNSWFTFSSYHESTGTRSRRPIHARELSMVNAFRPMEGPLMMATAFSQSLAVGKLPVNLPGVPKGVRFSIPRYNLEETTAALKYYYSRKITHREPTEEDIKKLFYLTNGNGEELRTLVRLI